MKHIHILGVCGTFMASLAILAKELGYKVTGSDAHIYPPMSDLLANNDIPIVSGYDETIFPVKCDLVIVGNALTRGDPIIEAMLNEGFLYQSGPAWLYENVLKHKHVLCVAGTHGKTTTASMLASILKSANLDPGFLIGGVCPELGRSACLGSGDYFVIEGDEYDTAFFDKRSKFIHYHPKTLVLNNLEFDHADIFDTLADIQKQMHHLIRIIPSEGLIIHNALSPALDDVLKKGLWSHTEAFGLGRFNDANWQAVLDKPDGSEFSLFHHKKEVARVCWNLLGQHNVQNALAAAIAANHIGVPLDIIAKALSAFKGVKRRLECIGTVEKITVYDDFAHHPTAIKTTLNGLRALVGEKGRIIAVFEPRSNTMKMGVHGQSLVDAFNGADSLWALIPEGLSWDMKGSFSGMAGFNAHQQLPTLIDGLIHYLMPGDHVVIMSNGGFGGVHQKLLDKLSTVS